MRALNIQLQLAQQPTLSVAAARQFLHELAQLPPVATYTYNEGGEDGLFLTCTLESEDVAALWALLQQRLAQGAGLAGKIRDCATIIASRQGNDWQDYLLLQHFDPYTETVPLV